MVCRSNLLAVDSCCLFVFFPKEDVSMIGLNFAVLFPC